MIGNRQAHFSNRLYRITLVAATVAVVAGCSSAPAPSPKLAQSGRMAPVTSSSSPCGGDFGMIGQIENDQRGWWDGIENPELVCRR
jgi:hypothetical protein